MIKVWVWIGLAAYGGGFAAETVENGMKPTDPIPFKVTQDFIIGADPESDDELFAYGAMAAASADGTIYVMDPGNHRIAVFDVDGQFKFKFGAQGQGPGEFQEITAITVTPDRHVVVFDTGSKRLSYFDAEGTFLSSTNFAPNIQAVFTPVVLSNGTIATGVLTTGSTGDLTYKMEHFSAEMQTQRTFFAIPQPAKDWSKMQEPSFWEDFLVDQFTVYGNGFPLAAALGKDQFIVARTNNYAGEVINQNGDTLFDFTKAYKPSPMTEEAKRLIFEEMWQAMSTNPFLSQRMPKPVFERALARMTDLQVSQPLIGIFALGDGFGVLAERDPITSIGRIDYFDAKGRFRASADIKGPAYGVTAVGSSIYLSGLDDEENVVVIRYKVDGI